MEKKPTSELIETAKKAKSAEELISLAKENGIELDEKHAEAYFARINANGSLSDDELDNVSGGMCTYTDDKKCARCGGKLVAVPRLGGGCDFICMDCDKRRCPEKTGF